MHESQTDSPSNRVAKVIVNEKDWSQCPHDSVVGSRHDKKKEGIDKHDEDAGYLDHSSRMCDEGSQSHPSKFHPTLNANDY